MKTRKAPHAQVYSEVFASLPLFILSSIKNNQSLYIEIYADSIEFTHCKLYFLADHPQNPDTLTASSYKSYSSCTRSLPTNFMHFFYLKKYKPAKESCKRIYNLCTFTGSIVVTLLSVYVIDIFRSDIVTMYP